MSTEPKPDSPPLSPQTMSFSYMGMTGINSLGTKDGEHYTLYLPTTTTLSGWSASRPKGAHSAIGAGVYSGTLDAEDKQLLEAMRGKLCRDLKWPAMRSPEHMFSYYMQCDGKVYTNSVDLSAGFPQGTEGMMSTFGELMDHFYAKATRTPVKLDVDYEVTLQADQFLVTLRFINNGEETLVLESPATWDGMFPRPPIPMGTAADLYGNLNFLLGGQQMINAKDYPNDEMVIPPGQSREARFIAVPTDKGTKGSGPSGGVVAMGVKAPKELGSGVDFRVINKPRTMPRDYPATPKEWEAWEASYRGRSNLNIASAVGKTMPEDGYYRAQVRVASAEYVTGRSVRPSLSHSNVARLYEAALEDKLNGIHRIYVPGVGTPFKEIGETTPHEDGASKGEMGAERIRYAVIAIINEASRLLTRKLIVPESGLPQAVKSDTNYLRWNHRLTSLITQARQLGQGSRIEEIVLDIFGFSRGAAEARSFVNQLLKHFSPNGKFFCSVPLRIRFMGLFDTVASVGWADAFPGPVEGHQGWGDEALLPIPPQVEQCVHLVAGHEGRKSFPVDLVLSKDGNYPSNCIEVVYPGVHSDVGGGYGPGEQGKGADRNAQGEMLSQIPLNEMYRRARAAGVPLRNPDALVEARLTDEFAISPKLQQKFDAYVSTVALEGKGYPAVRHYEAHFRYYLRWRRAVLHPVDFLDLQCVRKAGTQGGINLIQANDQFRDLVRKLGHQDRNGISYPRNVPAPLAEYLHEKDKEALAFYRKYWKPAVIPYFPLDEPVAKFFDLYVHDSRAGFTLVDPVTYHDHKRIHEQLKALDEPYQRDLRAYEAYQCIAVSGNPMLGSGVYCSSSTPPKRPTDPLTPSQRKNLEIYNKTPPGQQPYVEVPVYTDDAPGAYSDGEWRATDAIAAMDGRREARWSYLHPRQHFAYTRITPG